VVRLATLDRNLPLPLRVRWPRTGGPIVGHAQCALKWTFGAAGVWAPRLIHCGYYQGGSRKIAFVWIVVQVTEHHVRFLKVVTPDGVQLVFGPWPVN
jgi:hypothetical protein